MTDATICGKDDDALDHCDVLVVNPERVRAVRERLVTAAEAEQMAAVFKVLADPSRCRLVEAIIEAGELCVCDLAATVEMSESNVSHHLRVLRAHALGVHDEDVAVVERVLVTLAADRRVRHALSNP